MSGPVGVGVGSPSTGAIARQLALRNLKRLVRMPSAFIPSVLMPVFMTVAFASVYRGMTLVPGFPTRDPFSWFVPMSAIQGCAFGAIGMGFAALMDVTTRFSDRLLLAPSGRAAMVIGPLTATAVRGLFPYTAAVIIGLAAGADAPAGVPAYLMLFATCQLMGFVACGWALGLAYRIRTMAAAGPMQFSVMFLFFLSTANVPLAVMTGWLHSVARVNPMTNVFRMARQGFLGEISWHDTWPGLLTLVVAVVLTSIWAERSVRRLID